VTCHLQVTISVLRVTELRCAIEGYLIAISEKQNLAYVLMFANYKREL